MSDFNCPRCHQKGSRVPKPSFLNSEQWDAEKAGDFFRLCEKAVHPSGNCYWRKEQTSYFAEQKRQERIDNFFQRISWFIGRIGRRS